MTMEDESSFAVRTENGLIHLMSEEDVGKLVRNSIQRAKTSSAKATSFTRTRNRRSIDLALFSGRAHIYGSSSQPTSPRKSIDAPPHGSVGNNEDAPEDRKQDATDLFREASRRVVSRSRLNIRKEARVDSSSREDKVTNERESILDQTKSEKLSSTSNIQSPTAESLNNFLAQERTSMMAESIDAHLDRKLAKQSANFFSATGSSGVSYTGEIVDGNKSFTVNTEAEGRKNLSETEINNLVRSSIQRARQLAKAKGKRRTSPPGIGATIRKQKEKRDAPESSAPKKSSAVRTLGTMRRKFTWSSVEELSSEDESKAIVVEKMANDSKKKSGKKKREDLSRRSDKITNIDDKDLKSPQLPIENNSCLDAKEIAPTFTQVDLDDEVSQLSELKHGVNEDIGPKPHLQQQKSDYPNETKIAAETVEKVEDNGRDDQLTQTSNLSHHMDSKQSTIEENSNGTDTEVLRDADTGLCEENNSQNNLMLSNDPLGQLNFPSIPEEERIIPNQGGDTTFSGSIDEISLSNVASKKEVSTAEPSEFGSTEASVVLMCQEPESINQEIVTASFSSLPFRESAKPDLNQVTTVESTADLSAEKVSSLLKDLLFQQRSLSSESVLANFNGKRHENDESPVPDTTIKEDGGALVEPCVNSVQRVIRADITSQIIELPSQKLRSSLLGATNFELKETITFEGEISLPTVSDTQTVHEGRGHDEKRNEGQLPSQVVFDTISSSPEINRMTSEDGVDGLSEIDTNLSHHSTVHQINGSDLSEKNELLLPNSVDSVARPNETRVSDEVQADIVPTDKSDENAVAGLRFESEQTSAVKLANGNEDLTENVASEEIATANVPTDALLDVQEQSLEHEVANQEEEDLSNDQGADEPHPMHDPDTNQIIVEDLQMRNEADHQEGISTMKSPMTLHHGKNRSPMVFRDGPLLQVKQSESSSDEPVVHGKDSSSGKFLTSNSIKYRFSSSVKSLPKAANVRRKKASVRGSKKSFRKSTENFDGDEIIITDELIAEITSKKGSRVTAGQLSEMMKAATPKKITQSVSEVEEVTTLVSLPSKGSGTVHHRGDRHGKTVTAKNPTFAPSSIRSRFCMDFLDFFKHLVNDPDDDTVDEYTNAPTWKESVGDELVDNNITYETDGGIDEVQERSRVTFSFSDAENVTSEDTDAYTSAEDSKDRKNDWTTWK